MTKRFYSGGRSVPAKTSSANLEPQRVLDTQKFIITECVPESALIHLPLNWGLAKFYATSARGARPRNFCQIHMGVRKVRLRMGALPLATDELTDKTYA